MNTHPTPFRYDVVETKSLVIFIMPDQGADGRPASSIRSPIGLQITRADGKIIRLINLHPRLQRVLNHKPPLIIEVGEHHATTYAAGPGIQLEETIDAYFDDTYYWYIGPETASPADAAARPFARLIAHLSHRTTAVAPGEPAAGPLIGLSLSKRGILALAPGREWSRSVDGLIIDAGLACGTTSGFPAGDDIHASVTAAHAPTLMPPEQRPRQQWQSQIGVVVPDT